MEEEKEYTLQLTSFELVELIKRGAQKALKPHKRLWEKGRLRLYGIKITDQNERNIELTEDLDPDLHIQFWNGDYGNITIKGLKINRIAFFGEAKFKTIEFDEGEGGNDNQIQALNFSSSQLGKIKVNHSNIEMLSATEIGAQSSKDNEWHIGSLDLGNTKINKIWMWGSCIKNFTTHSNTIINEFTIQKGRISNLMLFGSTFGSKFDIRSNQYIKHLIIAETLFNGHLRIRNTSFDQVFVSKVISGKGLSISSTYINFRLTIDDCNIEEVTIDNTTDEKDKKYFINEIEFKNNISNNVTITGGDTNSVSFFKSICSSGQVLINLDSIYLLKFQNFINKGVIRFLNVQVKDKPTNQEKTSGFYLNEPASKLSMVNSNLGEFFFYGSDFNQFKIFEFEDSIFEKVKDHSSAIWPKKTVVRDSVLDKLDETESKKLQLAQNYRYQTQVRKWSENNNEKWHVAEYYSREMDAYLDTLSWQNDKAEILTLWANKLSSNHGTRWVQAVTFTIIVTAAFYTLYLITLCVLPFCSCGYPDLTSTKIAVGFFEFFLLNHKFGFLGIEENWLSSFFDIFGRIFIGYGIYQTIQAFRKHGRR